MSKIKPYPLTHQQGFLEITPDHIDYDPKNCDVGVQIAEDGRIWICVNGQALIRFKPKRQLK